MADTQTQAKQPSKAEQAEKDHAQAVASTHSAVPGPAATPHEPTKEEAKIREDALAVAAHLQDLDRAQLVALSGAVDHALRHKGEEPPHAGPTLNEVAGSLPQHEEETKKLDAAGAAGHFKDIDGVDEHSVVAVSVRQAQGVNGAGIGPKYVRIVTADGQKHTAEAK